MLINDDFKVVWDFTNYGWTHTLIILLWDDASWSLGSTVRYFGVAIHYFTHGAFAPVLHDRHNLELEGAGGVEVIDDPWCLWAFEGELFDNIPAPFFVREVLFAAYLLALAWFGMLVQNATCLGRQMRNNRSMPYHSTVYSFQHIEHTERPSHIIWTTWRPHTVPR